jgi:segregation and condensation protein B
MELKQILEAAMMAAARPLGFQEFANLFDEAERPTQEQIEQVLAEIQNDFEHRPLELKRVASGYRFQVRESFSPWVSRLFEERPGRYSRAFLETLAIIAYRQPATRGEIEDIRGVAVSSNIIKTMLERDWIHIVGHKDVPGRPALFATTRHFLDYFNLTSLSEMPPLQEFIDALDVTSSEAITDSIPQPVIAETHTKNNEIEHADSE